MYYTPGTRAIVSTQAIVSNPSTSSLLAEITGLQARNYVGLVAFGADTVASVFIVEHCLSSGLGSTALQSSGNDGQLGRKTFYAPLNQTAEYVLRFTARDGDRIRVRLNAAIGAGSAAAMLIVEPLD